MNYYHPVFRLTIGKIGTLDSGQAHANNGLLTIFAYCDAKPNVEWDNMADATEIEDTEFLKWSNG